MAGTPHRNLRMFGKLCGDQEDVGQRVIFVTTMWDKLRDAEGQARGKKREVELQQYWAPMLKLGAKTLPFDNSRPSILQIVTQLLDLGSAHVPVLLQEELVDMKRPLNETEAAQTLYTQFQTLLAQHKATLVDLERAAKQAQDPAMLSDLQAERQRIEGELRKTFQQAKSLKISFGRLFVRFFQRKAKAVSTPRCYPLAEVLNNRHLFQNGIEFS